MLNICTFVPGTCNTYKMMVEILNVLMDNERLHPHFSNLPDRVTYHT